jgi:hypothetical protein
MFSLTGPHAAERLDLFGAAVHGGGSSSSSSSSSETNQKDDRIAAEGSIVADESSQITINTEDISDEALAELSAFGGQILEFGAESFTFAKEAQREAFDLSERSLERSFDATKAAAPDLVRTLIKWGAVAGVAAVAAQNAPSILKELR